MSEEKLEIERDHWRKQAIAASEMLAQVLLVIGEPVVVPRKLAEANLEGLEIKVDINYETEEFTFSMVEKEEYDDAVSTGEGVS